MSPAFMFNAKLSVYIYSGTKSLSIFSNFLNNLKASLKPK